MRVLVLAHRVPYPPNKGEKIRTYHQIEYLISCGYEIAVYAVQHATEDYANAVALAKALNIEVFVEAVRFRHIRLLSGLFTSQTLSVCNFRVARLQKRFDACLVQDRPDAVLCTGSAMASYIFSNPVLNGKAAGKPVLVMDFMDLDSDKWDQYRHHSRFPMALLYRRESWLLSRYEKRINSRFSSCLFVTLNEKELFLARGVDAPERVFVVGNGVDMESFHPSQEPAKLYQCPIRIQNTPDMVFTGVMDYLPNEDAVCWFIENEWTRLRDRWPEARFSVVGMSPSERVNRLCQFPGVEVTGKVDSVLPYFHRANVFVAPLRLARGLQNKVLQAFAAGLPVVTTALGAEGIDCINGQHLIIAETPEDYFNALERLMNEPNLYRAIRENALCLVRERYSWHSQNRALLERLSGDAESVRTGS